MRSLALRLNLSVMTVSRVLRNAPSVSLATRKRVLDAAKNHGYRPDPALAVLNSYRRNTRHQLTEETIAYVSHSRTADEWRDNAALLRYFAGAQIQAKELGYTLEHFWLDEQFTGRRASQIFINRAIRGLIVGPTKCSCRPLDLDWTRLSAIAVGSAPHTSPLGVVTTNHFQSLELAWEKAWALGYRRIGLVLDEAGERRSRDLQSAAHFFQQRQYGGAAIPTLVTDSVSTSHFIEWHCHHQPDLVMCDHPRRKAMLATECAEATGTRFLDLNAEPRAEMSGVDQGHDKIGQHAMLLLHLNLVHRGPGAMATRDLILLDGTWREGRGPGRLPPKSSPSPSDAPAAQADSSSGCL